MFWKHNKNTFKKIHTSENSGRVIIEENKDFPFAEKSFGLILSKLVVVATTKRKCLAW